MTWKIQAGQICAFVGPSGSGKSTCVNLLERFYDPTQGKIFIDGHEIHDYDHKYLHRQIAMVGQEPALFNRTIRENILYSSMDSTDQEKMIQASTDANAHGFISELSSGYETRCGQRGGHLSGSLKQVSSTGVTYLSRRSKTTCLYCSSDSSTTENPSA